MGWCLRRELCGVQRDLACRAGQASSMIDKVLGGAMTVNLLFPFDRLYDFLTTTFLESSLGSMGEIALSSTSGVHHQTIRRTLVGGGGGDSATACSVASGLKVEFGGGIELWGRGLAVRGRLLFGGAPL